jgi:lariat debranching enzyme
LLRRKPYFRNEVQSNTLGSPANHALLQQLKPKFWFAAHLHVKFHATVRHNDGSGAGGLADTTMSAARQRGIIVQTTSPPAPGKDNASPAAAAGAAAASASSLSLVPSQVHRGEKVQGSSGGGGIMLDYKGSEDTVRNENSASTAAAASNVPVPAVQSSIDNVKMNVVEPTAEPPPVQSSGSCNNDWDVKNDVTDNSEQPSAMDSVPAKDDDDDDDKKASNDTTVAATAPTTQFVAPNESSTACLVNDDLTAQMTRFLSLDKCLPRREYLSIVHVPMAHEKLENAQLEYDAEWLAILRKTHHLTVTTRQRVHLPTKNNDDDHHDNFHVTTDEIDWINERFPSLVIPQDNFTQTVPPYPGGPLPNRLPPPLGIMGNPQTDELLRRLELPHLVTVPYTKTPIITTTGQTSNTNNNNMMQDDENEIIIDEEDNDNMDDDAAAAGDVAVAVASGDARLASQGDDVGGKINLDDNNDDDNKDNAVTSADQVR